jgi:hypothetical protein
MKVVINDGGRAIAGYKGKANDCVVRSIAIISGKPYREVYDECADIMGRMPRSKRRKSSAGVRSAANGVYTTSVLFKRYMASLGFVWTPTMGIGTGCTVHLRASELPKGWLIVSVSRHYTAVIDGVIWDTHDPSRCGRRCVYGYWRKP